MSVNRIWSASICDSCSEINRNARWTRGSGWRSDRGRARGQPVVDGCGPSCGVSNRPPSMSSTQRIVSIANFFVYIVRYAVLDWGPTMLTQAKHITIAHAAWMVAGSGSVNH